MSQPLTDEQITAVRSWADEGADLPAIQKRLGDEFEVHLTFMDTRFLISDLEIELKAEEEEEEEEAPLAEVAVDDAPTDQAEALPTDADVADAQPEVAADADAEADAAAGPVEKVTVTISELQRPGMMANGTATFANGQTADWYLDQMGQLGMNPTEPDFRPSSQQMLAFQKELQKVAQEKGIA